MDVKGCENLKSILTVNKRVNAVKILVFLRLYDAFHDTSSDPHRQKFLDKSGKHRHSKSDDDSFYECLEHFCC